MLGALRGAEGIMTSRSTHSSYSLGTYTLVRGQGEGAGGGSELSAWVDVCRGMCEGVS